MRTIAALLADRAARHPDRTFLRWEGTETGYADAAEQSFRHGNAFLAAGVRPGDHVALFLDNSPEFLWCLWGLGAIGAVAVPLNTAARGDLLHYYLERSDARWLVTEQALEERIAGAAARASDIAGAFRIGDGTEGPLDRLGVPVVRGDFLRSGAAHRPEIAVAETDVHGIFFTSGTTGPSKGALSPHSQPIAIAEQTVASFGYRADDVLYTCLPLFHVNALWYTSYAALWAGASVALGRRFSASRFWAEMRENAATVISSLGSMTDILLKAPESRTDRDHSVRTAFLVPTGREVVERFEDRFGVRVVSGFGATETFLVSALGPDRDPGAPVGSAGRITEYAQVRIADEHGRPVPTGCAGEILVRPVDVGTTLLVALRLCQGLAAGAELAGSVVMLAEVAPPARRGFWTSIPAIGIYCGVVLASLVGTFAYSLPQDDLLSWGWRIPFLLSIVLVVVGLWVRMRIGESPAFTADSRRSAPPTAELLRTNPRRLVLAIMLVAPVAAASAIVLVYSPSYSAAIGTPRAVPLLGSLLGAALAIFTAPLAGHLSDRFGRRPVYIALCLATAAWAFPLFALLSTAPGRCSSPTSSSRPPPGPSPVRRPPTSPSCSRRATASPASRCRRRSAPRSPRRCPWPAWR